MHFVYSEFILVLCTYRAGYRPLWNDKSYATQLTLPPLSAQDSLQVVHTVLQTEDLPEPLTQEILSRAQGNPFFLEEIAQTLIDQGALRRNSPVGTAQHDGPRIGDSGASPLPTVIHLPPTVQGVLAARIDRLPADEKALLQMLAVIGHVCSLRLLRQVVAQPEVEVSQRLCSLQGTELLYEQPIAPEPTIVFKHILTQDVAYHSLSPGRQRALHERTAQAIEGLFGEQLAERYGELAYHYSRSGNTPKAIEYLQRAGQQAADRSAYQEAIVHFTGGLALLQGLQDSPERTQQELEVQTTLGWALMAVKGQASPEVLIAFTRARELCQQVGETSLLHRVLVGLTTFHQMRGELELAEERFRLVQRTQDLAGLVSAHNVLGQALVYLGELAPARTHLEQGIALCDSLQHRSHFGGLVPGVSCRRHLARTLWLLGYPEQARQRSREALSLVQELSHPLSFAAALHSSAVLHQFCREAHAVHECIETLMALSTEQGFVQRVVQGSIMRGWVRAMQGQWEEGVAQMRRGLTDYQAR